MIVGGEAVIFYGHARYTGDVDFFYSDEDKNAKVLFDALSVFWDGNIPEINNFAELQVPGQILQFGRGGFDIFQKKLRGSPQKVEGIPSSCVLI